MASRDEMLTTLADEVMSWIEAGKKVPEDISEDYLEALEDVFDWLMVGAPAGGVSDDSGTPTDED